MARIHSITIKNFRGIGQFSHTFGESNFICLIGRGDSGKSTILEAISLVLSPSWNLTFYDSDFKNGKTENPIEIEASIIDLPEKLFNEEKYGLYIRGLDKSNNMIYDELQDDHEKLLTIKLVVEKHLEPKWYVINDRNEVPVTISAYDRARLNVFIISDYLDRHFSWSKGNPLYTLLKLEDLDNSDEHNVIIEALREAKKEIDKYPFEQLKSIVEKIKTNASLYGVDITNTSTAIDFKDISIKDGRVCLHEDNIPFRLKGKGTKRLISMAIQTLLAENGGIILIDEIEQALEPDRVRHLVSTLKKKNKVQTFITTHSSNVLVELSAKELFLLKPNESEMIIFDPSLQGCLRKNPEAFFARKILICEGATEIGICRALNNFRIKENKESAAFKGICFADGEGSNLVEYCKGFKCSKFSVCLFCDSDGSKNNPINNKKSELKLEGIKIIDWDDGDCLEVAVAKYLPFEAVKEMLNLAANLKHKDSNLAIKNIKTNIWEFVESSYGENCPGELSEENLTPELRKAIGKSAHNGEWFKSISKGEAFGELIFANYDKLENNKLKQQLDELLKWIDDI